jgi:hypothetical protein
MFITTLLNKILNANQTPNNTVNWSGTNGLKFIQDDIVEEIRARGAVVVPDITSLGLQSKNNSQSALVDGLGLYTWKPTGVISGTSVVQASDGGFWHLQANVSANTVTQILAGTNVNISPTTGIGNVTINAEVNPFALGINLPAPVVNVTHGTGRALTSYDVHNTNSDNVVNGVKGVYDINGFSVGAPALSVTLPNSRYSNYLTGGGTNAPEFEDINALNPKIFMFVYRKNPIDSKYIDVTKNNNKKLVKAGSFVHPANIINGNVAPTYSNFSGGKTTGFGYLNDNYKTLGNLTNPDLTDAALIQAQSEWDVNFSSSYETRVDLLNFNPFRFYRNTSNTNVAHRNFNVGEDFFEIGTYVGPGPYETFDEFGERRVRQNWSSVRTPGKMTQSSYNTYLAFALVIQNPLDPTQYIVGPMSKMVKQRLLMGYNSFGNKVPKAFTFMV